MPTPHAVDTVGVPTPPVTLVDFLESLVDLLEHTGDVPDQAKRDIRLWVQRHPEHNFLRRFESFDSVALWRDALSHILKIDDTDGRVTTPENRFLQFLAQQQILNAGDDTRRVRTVSITEMREMIASRILHPKMTNDQIRDHLITLSFNDLCLLYDLKHLPLDTTDDILEKALQAIVRKNKSGQAEDDWENHVFSRLFRDGRAGQAREYLQMCCFFPSMLSEVYTFLRSHRWDLIRRMLADHGDTPDKLWSDFWRDLPDSYRAMFPKRLWSLDRISEWTAFFKHLAILPDTETASINHALDKIRPPPRTKLIVENEEDIPLVAPHLSSKDTPLVRPPNWLKLSGFTIPLESRVTLFRTQPWLDSIQVADIVIQALSPTDGHVLIQSPFYTQTSFQTRDGETVWMPRSSFFEALFDQRDTTTIAPRISYHNGDETITVHTIAGTRFRVYFMLTNGQFVRMTRAYHDAQQKWFRSASEMTISNVKMISLKNILDRPLVQFGNDWLDRVRQKEVSILTEILSSSRRIFSPRYQWDFAKLADAMEETCANLTGVSTVNLTTLRTYWERIFLLHSLFRKRSVLTNLREIFEDRVRYGMLQLDRIPLAPLRVLLPELWALDTKEAEQVESIYNNRCDLFVQSRVIQSVGVYFPRCITERTPTKPSFIFSDISPIPIPYPSQHLETLLGTIGAKSVRSLFWDQGGTLFSLEHPENWNTASRTSISEFFDEDTFDAGSMDMSVCLSDMMRFTVFVDAPTDQTTILPETAGAGTGGGGVFSETTPPETASSSWILPDFVENMLEAISSLSQSHK